MSMALDRFTWFGLALAILGWVVLVADATLGPALLPGGMLASAVLRSDVFSIAETTIVSGFAIAILGALRAGFGALHAFFDAVLERAGTTVPAGPAGGTEPMLHPEPLIREPVVDLHPAPRPSASARAAPAGKGAATGSGQKTRNYTILDNGAVEVDTLLGTRIFASLDEARDYIR